MKEIKKYLESRIGKYSFFFEDLKSGYVYGYNENVSMTAAGCMKLPIAVSLIKAVEEKKLDFMDKIKIQSKDKVYGTGIIHEFNEREYTVFELMVIMQINEDIVAMGLKNTKLNRKTNDERSVVSNIENITTAYDLARIWKHLSNGTFLSKDNGQMLIDILRRQQIKNKLALYIPDDLKIEISSKTGDKKGVENDTEYLELPKGKFTFTVLSEGIPNSVYGTVSLAKCGKMMWDEVMNNWN